MGEAQENKSLLYIQVLESGGMAHVWAQDGPRQKAKSMGTAEGRACIGVSMEMVGQGKVGVASFNNFCEL